MQLPCLYMDMYELTELCRQSGSILRFHDVESLGGSQVVVGVKEININLKLSAQRLRRRV